MRKTIFCLLVFCLILTGCKGKSDEPGVIARVNGQPVYLAQLEYQYDLNHEGSEDFVPSVEQVREEYRHILNDLIIQKLVMQELMERGIPVTSQDVKNEENTVREDYPDGAFEQTLIEEYINIDDWREQLRNQLGMDKFFKQVLRPEIKIDYKEAEEYYRKHLSDFYVPAGSRLLVVSGPSRDRVSHAVDSLMKGESPKIVASKLKQVRVRETWIRDGQYPTEWENEIHDLKVGEASQIMVKDRSVICLILKEKKEATLLTPSQAYPTVEKVLLDKKLDSAFNSWLTSKLKVSDIKISEHLLKKHTEKNVAKKKSSETVNE
jgi:hypothetical protein